MAQLDAQTRLPVPPLDAVANNAVADPLMWFFTILVAVAGVYALIDWRRTRSPILPLMLIGGGIAFLVEPYIDVVAGCWHPEVDQRTVFTLMGRAMPLWLLPTYVAYFGIQPMLAFKAFSKGMTQRAIWLAFLIPVVTDIVLEETLMNWDVYSYYGNQPLVLIRFPVWAAAANSLGVLAAALATITFAPRLKGWARLGIVLITPFAYTGVFSVVAQPSIAAINSNFPVWATQLAGLGTFGLAFLVVAIFVHLFATRTPARQAAALTA